MTDHTLHIDARPRGIAARVGIVLLNLPAPGLGLLRIGRWRLAVACLAAVPLLALGLLAVGWVAPRASAAVMAAVLGLVTAVTFGALLISAAVTWHGSRWRANSLPLASRWYVLIAVLVTVLAVNAATGFAQDRLYKSFSMSSAAMMPTLARGDVMIADMRRRTPVRRGMTIVFAAPQGHDFVMRVVALPGDRIAVRNGVPSIDGRAVPQTATGDRLMITDLRPPVIARVLAERLPGEAGSHRVLDAGPSVADSYPEQRVPAGHVFVMGDNRDVSADSRFTAQDFGVGFVPIAKIRGEAYMLRNLDARFGRPIDPMDRK